MIMTRDEICTSYRDAKSKAKQITILAQLNACNQKKIKAILTARGYELPVIVPSNRGRKPNPEKGR